MFGCTSLYLFGSFKLNISNSVITTQTTEVTFMLVDWLLDTRPSQKQKKHQWQVVTVSYMSRPGLD